MGVFGLRRKAKGLRLKAKKRGGYWIIDGGMIASFFVLIPDRI